MLVIQGETFCAGDDITEMHSWGDASGVTRRVRLYQAMANAIEELDKVTVAAVDGFAVGGGLEITMACDFVVATKRAVWGMPEVDVGITPGWGGTTRMARLIGRRMTKEVNILGALHSATRAVQLGLWNRAVPNDRLEAEVDALIEVLLSEPASRAAAQVHHQSRRRSGPLHRAGFRGALRRADRSCQWGLAGARCGRRRGDHGIRRQGPPVGAAPWSR